MIHGQESTGIAVILDNLREPTASEWEEIERQASGIQHRVIVTQRAIKRDGWKSLGVGVRSQIEAGEIAKRHSPHCLSLTVINTVGSASSLAVAPAIACQWAPVRGGFSGHEAWYGTHEKKPWDFACEVSIPHLDSLDTLPTVIALFRAQSVRPFISIIDTGSKPETMAELERLRGDDLEIHYLRFSACRHSSDFPAIACDMAFSACRTEKIVLTHSDVLLRSRTALEELLDQCNEITPAVGPRMTPRDTPLWETTVSHTFSAFHMPTMDAIGAGWSLRRACRLLETEHRHGGRIGNTLDTESCLSEILRRSGIEPVFTCDEANFVTTVTPTFKHIRTLTGSRLYSPRHRVQAEVQMRDALIEAKSNLEAWKKL